MKDIRGYTAAYPPWNLPAELFGYIYNQLYAPLFPGNQELLANSTKGSSKSNGVAVTATNGVAVNDKGNSY